MRIGFFGNANNFPFMLAQAIRSRGHEAVFIVDSGFKLDHPEFRYDIPVPYPEWIHDLSPFRFSDFVLPTPRRRRAYQLLAECDAIVLNGWGPAFLPTLRKKAFVILTGSDLEYFADPEHLTRTPTPQRKPAVLWKYVAPAVVERFYRSICERQREGIRQATAVSYFPKGLVPNGDRLLDEIGLDPRRRVFFMMSDLEHTPLVAPPHNDPLRIFCATRLTWVRPIPVISSELDYKDSQIMIQGIGQFIRQTGRRFDIRLVRKGLHVAETVSLIRDEGFADQVTWSDEMTQKEVRAEFAKADIVFEQFGKSIVGMAGLDAMATGRPVIAHARPEILEPVLGARSPICHATNADEVAAQLARLMDPEERQRVGHASREYVKTYFSPEHAADLVLARLTA